MEESAKGSDERRGASALGVRLSAEQQRLLALIADGISITDAARLMHISRRTAVRRLTQARRILAAASTVHAVSLAARRHPSIEPRVALSPRERQVLELVGLGLTSSEAARRLSIKPSTVDSLVSSAMAKLDARTRAEAAARLAQITDEKRRHRH